MTGRNLLAAGAGVGVGHHVALSVVGADRLPASGYLRAKVVQEALIKAPGILYTIVRATQFFEFAGGIARAAAVGGRSGCLRPSCRPSRRTTSPPRRPTWRSPNP